MIDRKAFFAGIKQGGPFKTMTQGQVDGCNAILDEWEKRELTDSRWLAYMLATAKWETANTMQPIREYGRGKGRKYGRPVNGKVYYGRGYVQLTWSYNYKKMGDLLDVDLLGDPEMALDPEVASGILFEGMIRGSFTGKKLDSYFNDDTTDWINARRIINGTDKAGPIAAIAKQFYADIEAASA